MKPLFSKVIKPLSSNKIAQRYLDPSLETVSLFVFPVVLLIVAVNMYGLIAPIYAGVDGFDYDPAYAYLLNGVGLVQGYPPHHVDHPGTSLQLLTGIVLYLAWISAKSVGSTTLDFNTAILVNPEHYIAIISFALLILNVLAIFYLGIRVRQATNSISLALIAQGGFALLDDLMPRLVYLSPEALQIFAGVMIVACLADVLLSREPVAQNYFVAITSGFFIALGLTAKITFLPLILFLLILPTKRDKIVGLISLITFTSLFLLPIVNQLESVMNWMISLVEHRGPYGFGERDFIDVAALPSRLTFFYQHVPLVILAGGASLLMALLHVFGLPRHINRATQLRIARMGLIFLIIIAGQLVMVLKHFGSHYIVPAFSISPFIFAWSLQHARGIAINDRLSETICAAIALIITVISTQQTWAYYSHLAVAKRERDSEVSQLEQTLDAHRSAIVVGSFRVREPQFAIQFGLSYVKARYALLATQGRPEQRSLDRWSKQIFRPGIGYVPLTELNELIDKGNEVLMILPRDVEIPRIRTELLTDIPGKERIFKIIKVDRE